MELISLQAVTIGDGYQQQCQYICRDFTWQMHGNNFVLDVLLIPLGGCDLVLGIQWLATLETVKWKFKNLKMEFHLGGRNYILRGLKPEKVHMITKEQLPKALMNAEHLCMLQLATSTPICCDTMETTEATQTAPMPTELQTLLDQYQDIF